MGDVVLICDQWVRGMTLETSQVLDGARFGSAIDFGAADPRQQMSSLRPEVGSLRGGCGARYPGACEWRLSCTASLLCEA